MGVGIATRGNQGGLLLEELPGGIRDQFGGVRRDAVHRIQPLKAVGDNTIERIQLGAAEKLAPGISLGDNLREDVVGHGGVVEESNRPSLPASTVLRSVYATKSHWILLAL